MIQSIGVFPTDAVFAGLAWVGCATTVLTIRYGRKWRETVGRTRPDVHPDPGSKEEEPAKEGQESKV